jgi:Holliday junction resolvase RusA-like endonuclease
VLRNGHVYTPNKEGFQSAFHALLPLAGRRVRFGSDVTVELQLWRRGRRADIDNQIKAILDAMVACGILVDDRLVRKVLAEVVDVGPEVAPRIRIRVEPYRGRGNRTLLDVAGGKNS